MSSEDVRETNVDETEDKRTDVESKELEPDEKTPLKELEPEDKEPERLDKIKEEDETRDPEQPPTDEDPLSPEVKQPKRKFDFFENKWILLGILLLLLLAIIIIVIAVVATRKPKADGTVIVEPGNWTEADTEARANIFCGEVFGVKEDGAFVYRGMPYAKPPVGDLRWKHPVRSTTIKECWKAPYNATYSRHNCYQKDGREPQSEDCLYVDVFTPTSSFLSALPVMVYIGADDNSFLRGTDGVFAPSARLAKETGMVYVRFNYRVGALGYLYSSALGESSGNYGLMDQVEALQWVNSNIEGFGGDPEKVTVYGVGSGAASILGLISSHSAKHLFHRAWIASGVQDISYSSADAEIVGNRFAMNTPCADDWDSFSVEQKATCLRGLTSEQIGNADSLAMDNTDSTLYELPVQGEKRRARLVVNGHRGGILTSVSEAIKAGKVNDVPLLIGSMGQEVDFYTRASDFSWDDFYGNASAALQDFYPDIIQLAAKIKDFYPQSMSPQYQHASLVSDIRVSCPLDRLAEQASKVSSHVYRYEVVPKLYLTDENYIGKRWAFHGYDIAAFSGQLKDAFKMASKYDVDLTNQAEENYDMNFKSFLRSVVQQFASTGAVSDWETFDNNGTLFTYDLDVGSAMGTNSRKTKCEYWDLLKEYGWVF